MMTFTANAGPPEVCERLAATGSSCVSRRDLSTSTTKQASNANAIRISDIFLDVFMQPKMAGDRGGGQATEEATRLRENKAVRIKEIVSNTKSNQPFTLLR